MLGCTCALSCLAPRLILHRASRTVIGESLQVLGGLVSKRSGVENVYNRNVTRM